MTTPDPRYGCQRSGCDRHAQMGDVIIRTSPKGEDFEGLCIRHAKAAGVGVDPIEEIIEAQIKRDVTDRAAGGAS